MHIVVVVVDVVVEINVNVAEQRFPANVHFCREKERKGLFLFSSPWQLAREMPRDEIPLASSRNGWNETDSLQNAAPQI